MRKVFILTESFQHTGVGHLGRCTALSEILTEKGDRVSIYLDTDGTLLGSNTPSNLITSNWKDKTQLSKLLNSEKPDVVYIDSYLADDSVYQEVADRVSSLICIDDYKRIEYPLGSIILNPGFGGKYLTYDKTHNIIWTGMEHVLLRKPFRQIDVVKGRKNPNEFTSVLITVGGEDRYNIIPKLTKFLCEFRPDWEKNIIIGPGFRNLKEIEFVIDGNCRLHRNLSAEEMKNLMIQNDLAISAGGQTTYELDRCGTSMILIETADNQKNNIRGWVDLNVPFIGSADDPLLIDNLRNVLLAIIK
ncbi:UDP-2,4-diacetamido-2,4,6-trideoxy-beta-L-altropyranose hydrolase [Leptospira yasudae]|uniref:UDP-2,4-diacetamido-2,4, 6-trideoxy-beta-L-altropyranose hydrolase n=1 Tax=Leptospira yasudae TaxID=2202201 RepID=UPI001C4F6C06|nr:UDP-2,4-diacetamido-2,4,6-trideoxy-beta-L-altropyranose hydrolase [Leptospira yasudae]MBW0434106.1 UDP-2,4-diacetamido-2,4,6-trideoxy-beta-L-altropyranose hydrolase [Leptospira yasudae]